MKHFKNCLPPSLRLFFFDRKPLCPLDRARAHWRSKEYQQSLVYADQVLAEDPGNKSGLWTRALACWKLEKYADAIRSLDQATGLQRPKPGSFKSSTSVPLDKSNTIELFQQSLRVVHDVEQFLEGEVGAYHGFAWAASSHYYNNKDLALKCCDRALRLDPDRSKQAYYYNFRASCSNSLGRHKEALDDANKALKLSRGTIGNYTKYLACFGLGDYANAVTAITEDLALAQQKSYPLYFEYSSRGICYLFLGRLQEAIHDFTIAIALNSKWTVSLHCRAAAYIRNGEYEKALKDLDTYLEAENQEIESRNFVVALRALLLFCLGISDFSPAKTKFDLVKVLTPEDPKRLPVPYDRNQKQLNSLLTYLSNQYSKLEAAQRTAECQQSASEAI